MFGFNGCGWCHKLHGLFASDEAIRTLLADEYVLAMVDIHAQNADDLLRDCKTALSREELQKGVGYPFLAVLDGNGRVITAQRTDPLEVGDHHDPAKVKVFLEKWVAPKVAASKVFEEGLAKASAEDKLVFLHFGAPWCGWCHQLDAFLARDDMAPILGREFIDVNLDLDRMTGRPRDPQALQSRRVGRDSLVRVPRCPWDGARQLGLARKVTSDTPLHPKQSSTLSP